MKAKNAELQQKLKQAEIDVKRAKEAAKLSMVAPKENRDQGNMVSFHKSRGLQMSHVLQTYFKLVFVFSQPFRTCPDLQICPCLFLLFAGQEYEQDQLTNLEKNEKRAECHRSQS